MASYLRAAGAWALTKSPAAYKESCTGSEPSPQPPFRSALFTGSPSNISPALKKCHLSGPKSSGRSSCGGTRRRRGVRCAVLVEESYGGVAVQGTERAVNEDTYAVEIDTRGGGASFLAVFDGHGGPSVAEFLRTNLWPVYKEKLAKGGDVVKATVQAYLEVDKTTIAAPKGLFGMMRERGMGGSKCGATAASVVLLPAANSSWDLIAANVGDSRVYLSRQGKALQLTVDHKPDVEEERLRIERKNPTPKKPLVFQAGGVWRVGGLLALSRAFGDVYLKDWDDGQRDGASGGFGLTAEPSVRVERLTKDDDWAIIGTDGLWDTLTGQEAVDICRAHKGEMTLGELAKKMVQLAQDRGSTDDVTVVLIRLPQA